MSHETFQICKKAVRKLLLTNGAQYNPERKIESFQESKRDVNVPPRIKHIQDIDEKKYEPLIPEIVTDKELKLKRERES